MLAVMAAVSGQKGSGVKRRVLCTANPALLLLAGITGHSGKPSPVLGGSASAIPVDRHPEATRSWKKRDIR